MIPHIFPKGHFALLMKMKIMPGGLPELSRTIAYTSQSTDLRVKNYIWILWYQNDQRRNKPIHWASETYARSDSCKKHKNFPRQAYCFLEVKLRRLRRKTYEGKYDTRDKNLPSVLANSSNLSRARRHDIIPQKQMLGDFKTYLAIEMSQNNTLTHSKLQGCQTRRSDSRIATEIMQTDLLIKTC